MRRLKTLLTASIGAVAFAAAAEAADPSRGWPIPIEAPPPQIATEFASGWYIRGDIGSRFDSSVGSVMSTVPVTIPANGGSYENTFAIGGGFGYKWKWFRTDLTVDYALRSKIQANTVALAPTYTAQTDATTILANVYVDLGTWSGFTPYIGIGGGTTRFSVSDFVDLSNSAATQSELKTQKWGISWAWMAGMSYQLTDSLLIDASYRHLTLGDALAGPNSFGREVDFRKLQSQEIRIGFRLLID